MRLSKVRENCEKDFEVNLVHQSLCNRNVTVLLDSSLGCGVEVKVIRYHLDSNSLWQPTIMYDGDDYICGMNEFNKVLENTPVDCNRGLQFTCPDCSNMTLECCQDGSHVSRVTCINEEGDHDYGELESSGEVVRWQCEGCGYVLQNQFGDITDTVEVAEWIKENS